MEMTRKGLVPLSKKLLKHYGAKLTLVDDNDE